MPLYGFTWAQERVLDWMEHYPRGVQSVMDLRGCSRPELFDSAVLFLRTSPVRWESLKKLVKSQNLSPSTLTNLGPELRRGAHELLWWLATDEGLDQLELRP